jgi:hypothetical protein
MGVEFVPSGSRVKLALAAESDKSGKHEEAAAKLDSRMTRSGRGCGADAAGHSRDGSQPRLLFIPVGACSRDFTVEEGRPDTKRRRESA